MSKGSAFGKSILIGDQFVLEEVPAIVSAIPFETIATVERIEGEGWVLEDNRTEVPGYKNKKKDQQVVSINRILEVMGIDTKKTPLKITYGGDLLAGSGVGASAASCVSLARALNEEFDLGYSVEQINHVGWEGEFAYHGTPSGVDNTASTYGGLIRYWIKDGEKHFEQINVKKPLHIVLGNSGITANTALLDDYIDEMKAADPALFKSRMEAITAQVNEMQPALETGDLEKVGAIMTANHKILIEMGLSHEILIELCDMAIEMGALGAKVTGGGRGGYMNALTSSKEMQASIAAAMEAEGYKVITTTIGAVQRLRSFITTMQTG
ncbi:MAG: mevalonate kinase [Anaerolineaceae bacterium 4572_5.1]|nr:MAG: mevalonate kinase [Anaerolineaceae bacterium 4572_5.1]